MKTTKQARKIIRSFGISPNHIWNNKYTYQTTVKCYVKEMETLSALSKRLYREGYESQVTYSTHMRLPGLIVRIS